MTDIVIGASYNIERKSLDYLINESLKKKSTYYTGSEWVSDKIHRLKIESGSIPGVGIPLDINKNNFPIYESLTCFMFSVIQEWYLGNSLVVVGNDDVRLQVNTFKEYVSDHDKDERIKFVHEETTPSLLSTLIKGSAALNIKDGSKFKFITGDIPFADLRIPDYYGDNMIVLDFCGKRNIWQEQDELFPRNWHQKMLLLDGTVTEVKEPNVYTFIKDNTMLELAKIFYPERRTQGVVSNTNFFKNLAIYITDKHPKVIMTKNMARLFKAGFDLYANKLYLPNVIQSLIYDVFGYKTLIGAFHKDPFMLKDIDGWQDLFYYWLVIDNASRIYGNKETAIQKLLPFGDIVVGFDLYMKQHGIDKKIPTIVYKEKIANYFAERLNIGIIYEGGQLVAVPSPGEDIEGSVNFLIERTSRLKQYFQSPMSFSLA